MKDIKVLMSGCKCSQKFYDLVVKTVNGHGIDAKVERVHASVEGMQHNTMTLPARVVDGVLVARGQKDEAELLAILTK